MKDKELILGIGVTVLGEEAIIRRVWEFAKSESKRKIIVCANPHSIVLTRKDQDFFNILNSADICLPDGTGVVLASRLTGGIIKRRIAGPDFFMNFSDLGKKIGESISYFFLGSTEKTLRIIKNKMERLYPNIRIAGTYSPPFERWSDDEEKKMIDIINQSETDLLWVGFGAPKQEKWIYKNIHELDVKVVGAIGAAFDFFADENKRSPKIFRDLGLEWLLRFIMEPRRLWKRNVISTPKFLYLIVKEKIHAGKASRLS